MNFKAAGPMANPERMCVICRKRFPKRELLRHVLGQDGKLLADVRQILPGRGWYCCAGASCGAKFASFRPARKFVAQKQAVR